jgi:ferredoxin
MRISVDVKRCEGHGMCEQLAPEIFELDEDGNLINHYEGRDLDGELAAAAERAVESCPVAALMAHR